MTDITPIPARPIKWSTMADHAILITGALCMPTPMLMVLQTVTTTDVQTIQNGPEFVIGNQFVANFHKIMFEASGFFGENSGTSMLINSMILGLDFALGKIVIGMMTAYALVYFRLRFATFAF